MQLVLPCCCKEDKSIPLSTPDIIKIYSEILVSFIRDADPSLKYSQLVRLSLFVELGENPKAKMSYDAMPEKLRLKSRQLDMSKDGSAR